MKELTVQINENEYDFFLKLLQQFDFVTIIENNKIQKEVEKKHLRERLAQGLTQVNLWEQGKIECRSARAFLEELETEN